MILNGLFYDFVTFEVFTRVQVMWHHLTWLQMSQKIYWTERKCTTADPTSPHMLFSQMYFEQMWEQSCWWNFVVGSLCFTYSINTSSYLWDCDFVRSRMFILPMDQTAVRWHSNRVDVFGWWTQHQIHASVALHCAGCVNRRLSANAS